MDLLKAACRKSWMSRRTGATWSTTRKRWPPRKKAKRSSGDSSSGCGPTRTVPSDSPAFTLTPFNAVRPREYDGSHLSLPGSNRTLNLRPHQKVAVWRILQERSVGLFHEVGAGKTTVMAAAAMELRRLGLAKKVLIVVPNDILQQFAEEF